MIFEQLYLERLGHAWYLVGSKQSGEALVLDVRRDVDVYLETARRLGYAADSHQHVSATCELPERSDLQLLAGARARLLRRACHGWRRSPGDGRARHRGVSHARIHA